MENKTILVGGSIGGITGLGIMGLAIYLFHLPLSDQCIGLISGMCGVLSTLVGITFFYWLWEIR